MLASLPGTQSRKHSVETLTWSNIEARQSKAIALILTETARLFIPRRSGITCDSFARVNLGRVVSASSETHPDLQVTRYRVGGFRRGVHILLSCYLGDESSSPLRLQYSFAERATQIDKGRFFSDLNRMVRNCSSITYHGVSTNSESKGLLILFKLGEVKITHSQSYIYLDNPINWFQQTPCFKPLPSLFRSCSHQVAGRAFLPTRRSVVGCPLYPSLVY